MVRDFWIPLGFDVFVRSRRDNRVAHQENVGSWIREWSDSVVVLLAGSVPHAERNLLVLEFYLSSIVIEDGWDVVLWELVVHVHVQQARLSNGTVADRNDFNVNCHW